MALNLEKWKAFGPFFSVVWSFLLASIFVSAERRLKSESLFNNGSGISSTVSDPDLVTSVLNFLWQADESGYQHVWPEMEFNWKIIVGSIIGFFGAAFGSVGGVGGGGIYVPMLTLIIGFDPKSATAISKCMIMGAAASTVYYNLKLRHPTMDMPIIDYDLAVLIQPMLMLGISLGVAFNVVFADWMVTVLLIFLFLVTSTRAFFKGVETWKKETILKKEAARLLERNGSGKDEAEYKLLPGEPSGNTDEEAKSSEEQEVGIIENVCWKEFGLLCFVWVAFLALQLLKNASTTCSTLYWLVNLLQIPVAGGVFAYESVSLYYGWRSIRSIQSKGEEVGGNNFKVHQLLTYGLFGAVAGIVGGLLGLGGGFIMGPLFLELGVPPQVSSATATFAMMFSSSMSVVEYYLLNRFPVPYALYLLAVATVAAFVGQHVVRKIIIILGRASIIIFILAFTIFVSAISLGGVGISNMIGKIQRHEYMGFDNLCKYDV
ncbi:sulfite exporter TauE/SafE family protein 3 [Andrographis paniculata]|uniref:sulfite exporter TauE/SafE family protein 3 n=1 Tax=Andrographis paniculata TaxID=175694 RepID=UPI0021E99DD8|nr:sulfite exporter TauE/SafE family protein 3 [Andrographis paniculata]